MQSYDGFWLITNFFSLFLSKAMDKEPIYGQIGENALISVHKRTIFVFFYAIPWG